MSAPSSNDELLIEKLLAHLKAEGYSLRIQQWYPLACVSCWYCTGNTLEIEAIRSVHITHFLRRHYRLFHKRHGEASMPFHKWRHRYTGAINMLLRLVHGRWPIPDPPVPPRGLSPRSHPRLRCMAARSARTAAGDADQASRRARCSSWVGSDHVQTRKASATSRLPISMRT